MSTKNVLIDVSSQPRKWGRWVSLLIGLIVIVLFIGLYSSARQRSIGGLMQHLRDSGLTVQSNDTNVTPEEKKFVQDFAKAVHTSDPTKADTQFFTTSGIEVEVTQYKSVEDANRAYEFGTRLETVSRADDERTKTPHQRVDRFLNRDLIMRIDYYTVNPPVNGKITIGGEGVTPLDFDPKQIEAIRAAFMSY